ncbi:hypothetical protein GCM10017786_00650 [Amycolatopsis deserti]|uniref:DUF3883 domain-containing protein n=1 Tax=Amycolatopsis deserti TaxID=185696 RepID=A0ABQ3IFE3_9PSEU|nr:hypothetical protein GCM10017786_00650 [Amycolatopsis deserti]
MEPGALEERGDLRRAHAEHRTRRRGVRLEPVDAPASGAGWTECSPALPETERTRHLVVELKRPMRLTMSEFGQVNNYAFAIRRSGAPHDWDFWLIGTEVVT